MSPKALKQGGVNQTFKIMSVECAFEELDPHEQNGCYYRKGGIPAFGVLKTGWEAIITDWTNATQVAAAITAGLLVIAKKVKAELTEPSAVEDEAITGCGTAENITDGFDYTLAVTDFNTNASNDEFYNQLNRSAFAGLVFYNCDADEIFVVDKKISFAGSLTIPLTNRTRQRYTVAATWFASVNDGMPVRYAAPAGIFDDAV